MKAELTIKERAKQLIELMSEQTSFSFQECERAHYVTRKVGDEAGKKCALIAVNAILSTGVAVGDVNSEIVYEYYSKLKTEINKL